MPIHGIITTCEGKMINIGEKIKKLRISNNMSQYDLGNKLFVSDKTISSWETNRTLPSIDLIVKICDIFNVSLYNFIEEKNNNDIEIEVKIKTNDIENKRIKNLINKNTKYLGIENHVAHYYSFKYRDNNDEFLRVRKENNKYIINYKKKHENYVDEYESEINDFDSFSKILNVYGFEEICCIEKTREKYLYKDKYEISFDDVKNLGLFIEIEIVKHIKNKEEEYQDLISLLYELNINLNQISNKHYPEYFIK